MKTKYRNRLQTQTIEMLLRTKLNSNLLNLDKAASAFIAKSNKQLMLTLNKN